MIGQLVVAERIFGEESNQRVFIIAKITINTSGTVVILKGREVAWGDGQKRAGAHRRKKREEVNLVQGMNTGGIVFFVAKRGGFGAKFHKSGRAVHITRKGQVGVDDPETV
jgi:hypothetical protein